MFSLLGSQNTLRSRRKQWWVKSVGTKSVDNEVHLFSMWPLKVAACGLPELGREAGCQMSWDNEERTSDGKKNYSFVLERLRLMTHHSTENSSSKSGREAQLMEIRISSNKKEAWRNSSLEQAHTWRQSLCGVVNFAFSYINGEHWLQLSGGNLQKEISLFLSRKKTKFMSKDRKITT